MGDRVGTSEARSQGGGVATGQRLPQKCSPRHQHFTSSLALHQEPLPLLPSVPFDRPEKALAEPGRGPESEFALGSGDVQTASGLAVGLRRIPCDPSFEIAQFSDQLDQISNCDFATDTQIDRFRAVIALRGHHDAARAILDIEEFTAGRTGAPDLDFLGVTFHRVYT